MQTQSNKYTRKKMTVPFAKIKETGFIGYVKGFEKGFSKQYGAFAILVLETQEGEKLNAVMDGGLRGALKLSKVISGEILNPKDDEHFSVEELKVLKPDTLIEILHAGTRELPSGEECNIYDVFELTAIN